jgi:maltose O-acetyltransferase
MHNPPLIIRLANWVFDHLLPSIRWALFPVYYLSQLLDWVGKIYWILVNEYSKRLLGHCGEGVRIYGQFRVTSPQNIHLENNVHINENARIRGEGGLYIGENSHISRNLVIYTVNHRYEGDLLPYDSIKILKPVVIGKNVWIGINVEIAPGVSIGEGAIIGMGTLVAKDVPPFTVVGAAPQQVLKTRDIKRYHLLDKNAQYSGMSGFKID